MCDRGPDGHRIPPGRRCPLSPARCRAPPHRCMPDRRSSPRAHRLRLCANQIPVPASPISTEAYLRVAVAGVGLSTRLSARGYLWHHRLSAPPGECLLESRCIRPSSLLRVGLSAAVEPRQQIVARLLRPPFSPGGKVSTRHRCATIARQSTAQTQRSSAVTQRSKPA
jgi:hypothetical protein